ncbi:L,D-transpeptidase [Nakamurella flava]|uniref:L,D-transpeptidase n=1 Tax=Nakamurella flava TaxID=2576308 RepID=UPI001F0EC8E6|nr:Ig-like domain-containing protein [Nakamurella flava]
MVQLRSGVAARRRRSGFVGLVAAGALVALTACTSGSINNLSGAEASLAGNNGGLSSSAVAPSSAGDPTTASSSAPAGPTVTASPAFGSKGLSPVAPMSVTTSSGTLKDVTVTNPAGVQVKGALSTDGTTWTVGEDLGYGKSYTVTGTAVGTGGATTKISGTWTTVTPTDQITTSISPGDGAVVGVAAPVIVHLGYKPTTDAEKAEIMKHVTITTDPQVEGAWAWIRHDGDQFPSLDWRPREYWPANTKVHVESDIYGLPFGDNYFGGDGATSDFTIGRNQVVKADATAHNIVVQQDGQTVATYNASYGNGDIINDPNRVTRSGVHVVSDMQETTKMSNPQYGYTNVTEHWAVRISDNGEFIHQNQDTVDAQGVTNVSHGCINLSAEDAEAYFKTAMYGDPVEVTGTSVQLSSADGDIYDWAVPWDQWLTMG